MEKTLSQESINHAPILTREQLSALLYDICESERYWNDGWYKKNWEFYPWGGADTKKEFKLNEDFHLPWPCIVVYNTSSFLHNANMDYEPSCVLTMTVGGYEADVNIYRTEY